MLFGYVRFVVKASKIIVIFAPRLNESKNSLDLSLPALLPLERRDECKCKANCRKFADEAVDIVV